MLNNIPNNGQVYPKILVSQDIPKPHDLGPLYCGNPIRYFRREVTCRFSNNLKIPNNCILSFQVRGESFMVHASRIVRILLMASTISSR